MTRKFQDTWLSETLHERIQQFFKDDLRAESERLLSENLVQEVYVEPGRISSRITVDKRQSHRIVLQVPEISNDQFESIIAVLARDQRSLAGLYNNKLTDVCFAHDEVRNSLLFGLDELRAFVEDLEVDIQDARVFAVLEKSVHFFIENSLSFIALRGRGTEQFIHDVREARLSFLLDAKAHQQTVETQVQAPMLHVTPEEYYEGGDLSDISIVVRADELPAALLKRLDHLPTNTGLEFVDKNLEMAYERVTRLAQSLARFLQ